MTYHITWNEKGVILNLLGEINIQEINEANGIIQGDARLEDLKYQIWDLLEADLSPISKIQVEVPAAIDLAASKSVLKMKVAFIAQESHSVEVCQHYIKESKDLGSPWEFGLFNCMGNAMEWGES